MIEEFCIPVYVMNVKKRTERKEHMIQEFEGKDEFKVTFGIVN